MKHTILLLSVLLASGLVVFAEEPANDFNLGEISLGVSQDHASPFSSKFLEYRQVPNGLFSPVLRFQGQKNGLRYDFVGLNVRQLDEAYRGKLQNDTFKLEADFNRIPHNFGFDGKTLLQETSEGVWQMSNTLQQSFQNSIAAAPRATVTFPSLNTLVSPSLAAANSVDLTLDRQRGNLSFTLTPTKDVDIKVAYFRERRTGDRAASGTSFGFGNVVELPETLHYLTQDFGADLQYSGAWGVARAGFHYNWFRNKVTSFAFDNPFRGTDATDASAYTAPGAGSIAGPTLGLMALPPDNGASTGTAGVTFKLPKRTRLTADAALGQWTQDRTPFIPYTTNSAISPASNPASPFAVTDTSSLPAQRLDGKIDTRSFNLVLSSRPVDRLSFTARYRYWDLDNKTARVTFPGYVRFDSVWEAIPRITVPYGYKNQRLDATAGYDFGPVTLEGGYRYTKMDRTFRETEGTTENAVNVAANLRAQDWLVLRASYEHGKRNYNNLEIGLSEDASQVNAGLPVNILSVPGASTDPTLRAVYASFACGSAPCNLRFDQAARASDRINTTATLTPGGGKVSFVLGYLYTKDNYDQSRYGLTAASYDTFSADVDYTPNERWNVFAFYAYEKNKNAQRGRQSGATLSTNPLDDWTSDVRDKVNAFGAGATVTLVPEKWTFNLLGRYQKVDGNNAISAPQGGAPAASRVTLGGVQGISAFDDTELWTINGELRYQFAKQWAAALGGWYDRYVVNDSSSTDLPNYVPGSFFLAANDGSYKAKVGYVRLTYRW